jgi:hypothetical protein
VSATPNDVAMPARDGARSFFVTAIGVLGIGFGLLTAAAGALLLVGFRSTFGGPELDADLARLAADPRIPAFNGWLLTHLSVVFGAIVAFGFAVVVASIAMLRRRNWGRLGVLATLWLGVAANVLAAAVMLLGLWAFPDAAAQELVEAGVDFRRFMGAMVALVVGGAMFIVSLHAWIIWRLAGVDARREFGVE